MAGKAAAPLVGFGGSEGDLMDAFELRVPIEVDESLPAFKEGLEFFLLKSPMVLGSVSGVNRPRLLIDCDTGDFDARFVAGDSFPVREFSREDADRYCNCWNRVELEEQK